MTPPALSTARPRHRGICLIAVLATIAAGLVSRRYPGLLPAFLGKYPGDALWALMVFFGWATVFPRAASRRIALGALATAYAVECLKLWQAPWLDSMRHTAVGYLVLGRAFSWQNLLAYTAGVVLGLFIEFLRCEFLAWKFRSDCIRPGCIRPDCGAARGRPDR